MKNIISNWTLAISLIGVFWLGVAFGNKYPATRNEPCEFHEISPVAIEIIPCEADYFIESSSLGEIWRRGADGKIEARILLDDMTSRRFLYKYRKMTGRSIK